MRPAGREKAGREKAGREGWRRSRCEKPEMAERVAAVGHQSNLIISFCYKHVHARARRGLDDYRLQSLGVFDGNHRRSILHKTQSGLGGEADLDNVLTDLSSVIADLEAFTVVSPVP